MTDTAETRPITPVRVAAIALPVVLSNAAVPLQGAIDTAIIGNLGETAYIAAVGLGASVISLLFVSCNFLQTGASGLSAQALGAGRRDRVINTLLRTLIVAAVVALLFLSLRPILIPAGLAVFEASAGSEALAAEYLAIRLWGAPAELGIFAVAGWFAGQELTRRLFELQVLQSVLNVAFNLVFVLGLGMDVDGVALGTLIAAYLTFGFGLWRAARRARAIAPPGWRPERARILDRSELIGVMRLNRDIFLRTILLTASLAWIARLGTLQNDTVFAANAVLMQFFFVSAAALDGFAIAAEALVGKAVGARNVVRLRQAVRVSTASAFVLAALFSLVASLLAVPVIHLFTNVPEVRAEAGRYALWATMVPVVGVFAFLLDGIFVGATEARRMRNAMFISAGIFLPGSYLMTLQFGNHGLWAAVLAFFGLRALTLAFAYPAIEARIAGAGPEERVG